MSRRRLFDDNLHPVALVATVIGALCLILLAVLLFVAQLSRHGDTASTQELTAPGASSATGVPVGFGTTLPPTTGYPAPTSQVPVTPLTTPGTIPAHWHRYVDQLYGFELELPEDWREATIEPAPMAVAEIADHDVAFEQPDTRARIAVSVWDAAGRAPFALWLGIVARGMVAVDGQLPTNAWVAGQPALVVWSPDTPTTPAHYGVFLERDGRYYRLTYSATDGGAGIGTFLRALVTLTWNDEPATDLIPRLPLPREPYYPSERLFGQQ
jgi:hypothetical protein